MAYQSIVVGDELVGILSGPFDGNVAPKVYGDLAAAFVSGVKRVVIDLCDCHHVDDGAMAVLSAAAVAAINSGGHLFLAIESDLVVEIVDASLVRAVFGR